MKTVFLFLVLFLIVSCTKKSVTSSSTEQISPAEQTVQAFINLSLHAEELSDKEKLSNLCTGDLKRAFLRMTDEVFKVAYLNGKIRMQSFEIIETKVEEKRAKIRYRIQLENSRGTDHTIETNEREMGVVLVEDAWLIEDIRLHGHDRIAFTNGMIL